MNRTRIKFSISISALMTLLLVSCNNSKEEQHLNTKKIKHVQDFVRELTMAFDDFEFDYIKKSWSHDLFKRRIGQLGNTGHGVFNHMYETTIKGTILNFNLNLINRVKHSGATLKHIDTNIVSNYAEVTYMLIEDGYYYFIKYRVDIKDNIPYLTDIYVFKDDEWYSSKMREMVLLNLKHTALSSNRQEANRAYGEFQSAVNTKDYEYAYYALNQIPESHRVFNYYKIARIKTAAILGDSILLRTIEEENDSLQANNIYVDYLMAFYLRDSIYQEEVASRMREEIGIPKSLLDSLNSNGLIWE